MANARDMGGVRVDRVDRVDDRCPAGKYIVAIGIDRYASWGRLDNAVSDARGVMSAFEALGFQPVRAPILDGEATRQTMMELIDRDLAMLGSRDSLVVFFAGHGWTTSLRIGNSHRSEGFLIPVDGKANHASESLAVRELKQSWVDVDLWLSKIQELPIKHILVILDSCHSGVAIRPAVRGDIVRGEASGSGELLWNLMSRRVITASHASQSAMDSGPVAGHSLFTGCLLRTLTDSMYVRTEHPYITGTELGVHVRRLVLEHSNQRQTPDVSPLAWDERGEMKIPLVPRTNLAPSAQARANAEVQQLRDSIEARGAGPSIDHRESAEVEIELGDELTARLERHQAVRQRGGAVLSMIAHGKAGDAAWATWAARHGWFTLLTAKPDLAAAIDDLLSQVPWMRAMPAARRAFAAAAGIVVEEIEAAMAARSDFERAAWIRRVAHDDPRLRVSGWMIAAAHERYADEMDLAAAPLHGLELFAVVCELASPISILIQPADPTATAVATAIDIAARLIEHLPKHPIAVSARHDRLAQVLRGPRDFDALSMARQGFADATRVRIRPAARTAWTPARRLWAALEREPRTTGQFTPLAQVAMQDDAGDLQVALIARRAQLVIEIDSWYQLPHGDVAAYRRDRARDVRLQRAGFFVIRLLGEDIDQRIASQVEHVATCLQTRTTVRPEGRDRS